MLCEAGSWNRDFALRIECFDISINIFLFIFEGGLLCTEN